MSSALARSAGHLAFLIGAVARFGVARPIRSLQPHYAARAALALAVLTVALIGTGLPVQAHHEDTAPRGLSARIVDGGVMLRWSAPAEGGPVDGYEILRKRPNRGEHSFTVPESNTANAETTYTDDEATEPGVRYTYRVKAIRGGVRSPWSHYATVLLPPYLVSNIGQSPTDTATITQQYAMGFRLGSHGQGYEISSVLIDLAAAPTDLTVSLWMGVGPEGFLSLNVPEAKVFDFESPSSFVVGMNRFTAPEGAFAYQNAHYFIVLSDFGTSLSIMETTSDGEDVGGESGATLGNSSRVRPLGSTGPWRQYDNVFSGDTLPPPKETIGINSTSRGSVLRLAVEGSRRDRGILASTLAQPPTSLETFSVNDNCCFTMGVGSADRYLIRRISLLADDTQTGGPIINPLDVHVPTTDNAKGDKLFSLTNTRDIRGINEWTAPQGATVEGGSSYIIGQGFSPRRGAIVTQIRSTGDPGEYDTPKPPGVTLGKYGDIDVVIPIMSSDGEPVHAMVSTLGQTDNSFVTIGSTYKVLSQGFTTGPNPTGYRLQGIGVEIEGSQSNVPSGPSAVSVAVHADSNGQPGAKLFDLVSPDEYAADALSFFEAPAGTTLDGGTHYVLVWSHLSDAWHRLHQTTSDSEDSDALTGFSIADVFHRGASLTGTQTQSTNSLQMAVYGEALEAVHAQPPEYQMPKDWLHIPSEVKVGDRFGVAFVTFSDHRTTASSDDVEHHNEVVRRQAAAGYNDRIIRGIAPDFRAVVCTESVDAGRPHGLESATYNWAGRSQDLPDGSVVEVTLIYQETQSPPPSQVDDSTEPAATPDLADMPGAPGQAATETAREPPEIVQGPSTRGGTETGRSQRGLRQTWWRRVLPRTGRKTW